MSCERFVRMKEMAKVTQIAPLGVLPYPILEDSAIQELGEKTTIAPKVQPDITKKLPYDDKMLKLAMSELFGHEVNNALTPIIGYVEFLQQMPKQVLLDTLKYSLDKAIKTIDGFSPESKLRFLMCTRTNALD